MQLHELGEMAAKGKPYTCNSPTSTCCSRAPAAGCRVDSWWTQSQIVTQFTQNATRMMFFLITLELFFFPLAAQLI